jgi:hypothetical protein
MAVGLSNQDHSGRGVPWVATKGQRGVGPTVSEPGKVDRRGAKHADPLNSFRQQPRESRANPVLHLSLLPYGVVADAEDGICRACRPPDPNTRAGAVRPEALDGRVEASLGRDLDDAKHWLLIGRITRVRAVSEALYPRMPASIRVAQPLQTHSSLPSYPARRIPDGTVAGDED